MTWDASAAAHQDAEAEQGAPAVTSASPRADKSADWNLRLPAVLGAAGVIPAVADNLAGARAAASKSSPQRVGMLHRQTRRAQQARGSLPLHSSPALRGEWAEARAVRREAQVWGQECEPPPEQPEVQQQRQQVRRAQQEAVTKAFPRDVPRAERVWVVQERPWNRSQREGPPASEAQAEAGVEGQQLPFAPSP